MKHPAIYRLAVLALALALCMPAAALAEELGEVSLNDPVVCAGEPAEAVEEAEDGPETVWTEAEIAPEPVEAPVEEIDEAELPAVEPAEAEAPDAGAISAPEDAADFENARTFEIKMGLGETYPIGAALQALQSDNTDVVTVDVEAATMRAVGLGTARVAAMNRASDVAVATVQVLNAPESLSLGMTTLTLGKGETLQLQAALPEGTGASRVAWSSSKSSVVKVSKAGLLTAKKTGTAVITAKVYSGAKAKIAVKVVKAPSSVQLSASKLVLDLNGTGALKAKLSKGSASAITWISSDGDVVAVDAEGGLRAVRAGTAVVRARTYNGLSAKCQVRVLEGSSPTVFSLGVEKLTLGKGEKTQLTPSFGAGECAVLSYSSNRKSVATVTSKGVIAGKKAGYADITVKTHNGLKATVRVRVVKAPTKVALSAKKLSVEVGQTTQLTAKVTSGASSVLTWKSSDPGVATVDAEGRVTGVKAGTATVAVKTFNNKYAKCAVTVVEPAQQPETPDEPAPESSSDSQAAAMAARLRASSALGGKHDAIASVVELLVNAGFEPAFAAGVGANIYAEGTYGLFESSKYIKNYQKRPRYFCYLDGGEYYTKGNGEYQLTAVYLSPEEAETYTGDAEVRLRYGEENYYRDNFSGKYVQDIKLTDLEALVNALSADGWKGKFGLGIVQWTGARTRTLTAMYRKHADANGNLTKERVAAAENEMILYDFKGDYARVYTNWKSENAGKLTGAEAARSAGALVCTKYEIPVDKESKAVTRGAKAQEIYGIMMGE